MKNLSEHSLDVEDDFIIGKQPIYSISLATFANSSLSKDILKLRDHFNSFGDQKFDLKDRDMFDGWAIFLEKIMLLDPSTFPAKNISCKDLADYLHFFGKNVLKSNPLQGFVFALELQNKIRIMNFYLPKGIYLSEDVAKISFVGQPQNIKTEVISIMLKKHIKDSKLIDDSLRSDYPISAELTNLFLGTNLKIN